MIPAEHDVTEEADWLLLLEDDHTTFDACYDFLMQDAVGEALEMSFRHGNRRVEVFLVDIDRRLWRFGSVSASEVRPV